MKKILLLIVVLGLMSPVLILEAEEAVNPEIRNPDQGIQAPEVADGRDNRTDQVRRAEESQSAGGNSALTVTFGTGDENDRAATSNAVKLFIVISVLSLAPAFLMMMTCFPRIIIVLGFLRRALGTQTLPPNQVMIGVALFMTFFVMAPTFQKIYDQAYSPYMAETINEDQALANAEQVIRGFLVKHTRKNDLIAFIRIAGEERPRTVDDVPFTVLIPAFVTSELKTAFQMGFVIFLPFLVIDLVIAALLMALGMMMLPPVVVSLPFKILLFILVDGWTILLQGIVIGY